MLRGDEQGARVLRPGELAWLATIPCAVMVVGLVVVLGRPLGRIFLSGGPLTFWPSIQATTPPRPEPTEQARFLLALTAPLLLTGAVLLGKRRSVALPAHTIVRLVTATQAVALAFVVVCYVVQQRYVFLGLNTFMASTHTVYFTTRTLAAAGGIALLVGLSLASRAASRRFLALTCERRARRIVGTGVATVAVALWLLAAINTDGTIGSANEVISNHLPFWLDESFAVLDGRPPLVGFAAQYGSLWPYPVAAAMALLGSSIGVFTIAMATVGGAAMLALFALLRRIVRSTLAGLLLFVPVLATGFFMMHGPLENRYAIVNLFGTYPLRYAGPLLVAWLLARHLDGAGPRRTWWLFLAAGLALLNNADFGVPALGATFAALLSTNGRPTLRRIGRLAGDAAIGLLAAVVMVSLLTLVVANSLPHFELLFRYARLYARSGWAALPMVPTIGVSTILYLTYVAAIGTATVRAVNAEPDRLMTGMLAWSGVFGLGIGSYYMGRSHPEVLTNMFLAWALSVVLLFVLAARAIAARSPRVPTIPEAACLFAFGVLVCSVAQTPAPWSQIERLQHTGQPIYRHPRGEAFIAAHTRRGERVAILSQLGHRAAYNLGIVDANPYTGNPSMPTEEQFEDMLRELRAAGGRKVFVAFDDVWREIPEALLRRGYVETAREAAGMAEFTKLD